MISQKKVASIHTMVKRKKALESKYDFMLGKKWELQAELSRKKQQLETLINNETGYKIKTAAQVCISEEDVEEKISTYLLASGKISLEQDHKIRKEKCVLNMDYLSTGVTLGYIDLKISEQLGRGNWTLGR
ncbi:hypothetical protein [Pseudodesulfovibrio portus]|uniref:Uncharacterized protein n=1 Tax=Pseudodesulfovibrio portus TaxID=231439 RepID=A0ABN6RTV7_9BACT|nr:hypothetical protein [Pseudodesulfovibrio portus]BDQ32932.1 hypothetical protein JCM14722_04740 [Pseudodesulfovibrio portus]